MLIERKDTDYSFGMISDEILYMILEQYGFEDEWIVLPFIDINRSAIAINKRSETARKAVILYRNVLYIVKEVPWYVSNEAFTRFEMAYQDQVRKQGSKVPKLLRANDGKLYVSIQSGNKKRYIFIQEYVVGGSWDGSIRCIKSAAATLAKLHNHSLKISSEIIQEYNPPIANVYQLARKMLDILVEDLGEKKKLNNVNDVKIIQKFHDVCIQKCIVMEIEAMKLGYDKLQIPVHGDYNPWNIVTDEQQKELLGVIDFDNAIVDNPIHDVVEAILDFCYMSYRNQTTRFSGIPTFFNTSYAVCFLSSYQKNIEFNFNQLLPYIKSAATVVAIELFSLGIIRGDYLIQDCPLLLKQIEYIGDYLEEVLNQMGWSL